MTGKLLRIFTGEDDRFEGKALYMAIVEALREADFAGATVLKGIEGYGVSKAVHSGRMIDVSANLPVLVEVVEEEAKIVGFLPRLRAMMTSGLLTLENIELTSIGRERSS